jgi:hypothetical protein
VPQEKDCSQCRRTLAASCFSRERAAFDGLQKMCRECKRTYSGNRKQSLFYVAVPSKRCCECKTDKPAAAFSARPRATDGLGAACRECASRIEQQRKQRRAAAAA